MGNVIYSYCCGGEEDYKHGAWYGPEDEEHRGKSSFGEEDDQYDDKATDREQLILLHEKNRGLSNIDIEDDCNNGNINNDNNNYGNGSDSDSRPGLRRNRSTIRLKRENIQSTPLEVNASFKFHSSNYTCPKSEATTKLLLDAMGDNFVFDSIDQDTKLLFVNAMQSQEYNEGDWVMKQGDVGDYFYIVEEGEVAFHVGPSKTDDDADDGTSENSSSIQDSNNNNNENLPPQVGTGSKGSNFGELALLYNTPRAASIRALTPLKLFKIDQRTFRSLLMSHQLNDRSNLISTVQNISVFQDLDDAKVRKLVDAFTIVEFSPGERIVNKGDRGNVLYIVKSGQVKVDDIGHGSSKFQDQILVEGDCFGERALVTGETRAANVSAVTQSSLLAISKGVLEEILGPLEEAIMQSSCSNYLQSIPLFECLETDEIDRCVKYLVCERFGKGEKIVTRGKMYLIQEGHVLMTIAEKKCEEQDGNDNGNGRKNGVKRMDSGPTLVKLEKGDYFGDLFGSEENCEGGSVYASCGKNDCNTVSVETDMKCLTLHVRDLETVIGNLNRVSMRQFDPDMLLLDEKELRGSKLGAMRSAHLRSSAKDYIKEKRTTSDRNVMNLTKLKKHRVLGMGTFGKVWLVTPKSNTKDKPTPYALKIVSKRQLLQQKLDAAVMREKNVMESIQHPFLLHMVSSFQDENVLYFVMDLILGGELFELIYANGKKHYSDNPEWRESAFYKSFGTKEDKQTQGLAGVGARKALFYGAGVIEAFAYLHNRRIVYRDLKPENVMLNEKGYCVVVDMGFAKVVLDKTYTICGTLEYLAPEVITTKGHNQCADYWSFACLLYELIVGHTPFFEAGLDQMSLLKKIVKADFTFPSKIEKLSPGNNAMDEALCHWKDLISRLLKPKSVERLGNLQNGIEDILDHDWFANVDFSEFRNQSIPAPWIPTIVDPLDTSHFGNNFGPDKAEVFRHDLTPEQQACFRGF